MLRRAIILVVGLSLAARAVPVRAGDEAIKPFMVLSLKSVDGTIDDIKYLIKQAKPEAAGQIEFASKLLLPQFLLGVDTKKPLGFYAILDPDGGFNPQDNTAVLLVPVSDEKSFLKLLNDHLPFKPKQEDDEVYSVSPDGVPVIIYFRFANGYVHAAIGNRSALDKKKLIDPSKVLPAKQTETVLAVFHMENLPPAQANWHRPG